MLKLLIFLLIAISQLKFCQSAHNITDRQLGTTAAHQIQLSCTGNTAGQAITGTLTIEEPDSSSPAASDNEDLYFTIDSGVWSGTRHVTYSSAAQIDLSALNIIVYTAGTVTLYASLDNAQGTGKDNFCTFTVSKGAAYQLKFIDLPTNEILVQNSIF